MTISSSALWPSRPSFPTSSGVMHNSYVKVLFHGNLPYCGDPFEIYRNSRNKICILVISVLSIFLNTPRLTQFLVLKVILKEQNLKDEACYWFSNVIYIKGTDPVTSCKWDTGGLWCTEVKQLVT